MNKGKSNLIAFRLPPDVISELKELAKSKGISVNEYARNLVIKAQMINQNENAPSLDRNVVKMICRSLCITQRLVGETIEGGIDILNLAENDVNIIMKKIGYEE